MPALFSAAEFARRAARQTPPEPGEDYGDHRLNPDLRELFAGRALRDAAVLVPVVDRGEEASVMWANIVAAAEAGAKATRSMVAARGRAARLGERSLGHVDPGAASTVIILRAMRETLVA